MKTTERENISGILFYNLILILFILIAGVYGYLYGRYQANDTQVINTEEICRDYIDENGGKLWLEKSLKDWN